MQPIVIKEICFSSAQFLTFIGQTGGSVLLNVTPHRCEGKCCPMQMQARALKMKITLAPAAALGFNSQIVNVKKSQNVLRKTYRAVELLTKLKSKVRSNVNVPKSIMSGIPSENMSHMLSLTPE